MATGGEQTSVQGGELPAQPNMTKEWWLWLIGWVIYPLIAFFGRGGSPEYQQVRLAIRAWLHAKPNRELRREIHRLSAPERKPAGGW